MAALATPGFATQDEVYAALIRQGANQSQAQILAAITRPESSGYTHASNGTYLGLFQIGNYHGFDNARLMSDDIDYNAAAALQILHQQGYGAWETYTNKSYLQYMNQNSPALSAQGAQGLLAGIASAVGGAAASGAVSGAIAAEPPAQPLLAPNPSAVDNPTAQANPVDAPGTGPSPLDAPGQQLASGEANPIDAPGTETVFGNPIDGPHGFDSSLSPSGE